MLQIWFTFQTKCHFKPLKNDDKKKCFRCGLPFKANHTSNDKRTVIKRNITDVVYLSNQITFWTIKKNGDIKKCFRCGLPFKANNISNHKRTVIKRNAKMWFTFQTKSHFKPLKNDDKKKCYRFGLPFKANHISNHKRTVIKRNITDVVYLSNQITSQTIKERL